jgi:hypothetical protein
VQRSPWVLSCWWRSAVPRSSTSPTVKRQVLLPPSIAAEIAIEYATYDRGVVYIELVGSVAAKLRTPVSTRHASPE